MTIGPPEAIEHIAMRGVGAVSHVAHPIPLEGINKPEALSEIATRLKFYSFL